MVDAGSIWIRLGLDTEQLQFGLDKAKYSMLQWRGETNQNSMEMAKWGAAIAAEAMPAIALAAAIWDVTSKAAALGKEIKDNARDLGLTTDEYQQWSHASVVAGGTAESMTASVRMMTVRMKEAADPTSDMGKQFAALGVKVTDSNGNMRSTNEVLKDVFGALNQLPEGFARNQAQMQIFGRGFSNISDLAGMTKEQLQALLDQAPIIDSDKIQKMDAYKIQLALVNEQWGIAYAEIGTELIPVMQDLMQFVSDYGVPAIGELATILEWAGRGFHIVGSEAKAAYEILENHDFGAAKQEMQDLANWIESEQVKIGLKASGYTPGAVYVDGKWIKPTKSAGPAGTPDNSDAEKTEKDRVSALVDAWKEYQDALKKVSEETKKLQDINKDFQREMSVLNPRDVSAARNLILKHQFDLEDQQAAAATQSQAIGTAATEFNAIRAGTPLEQVKGTSQYTEAQAKASGDLIIKVPGVVTTAGKMNLMQRGIS
jgi:hypothetical protein